MTGVKAQAEALLALADYIDASRTWDRTKHGSPEAHEAQQEMWRLHKDLTDMGPIALRAQARQVVELAEEVERLQAERDAYRGVVTKLANLSTNYPTQAITPEMLSQLFSAADAVTHDRGCEDCAGLTLDDGTLCCWTCGRAIPDALKEARHD